MSKRLDVLKAVKALVGQAAPTATVVGLDGDEAPAARVGPNGRIVVRSGDPGEPEVDLSPLAYNWMHRIPVELVAPATPGLTSEEALDAMVTDIGDLIEADRTLGALCEWLDVAAPETENAFVEGAKPPRTTELIIVAHYVTSSPTG